jgi:hypothetical protein
MSIFKKYIRDEWKENIRTYKYQGSDLSILYVHVTSPLCNKLVEYIPPWIV